MATKITSLLTAGTNNHQESSENANKVRTQYFSTGIIGGVSLNTGAGGTGGFAVNAQASPNNTLRVTQGEVIVAGIPTGGNSQNFSVNMNTFEDITILANATGGTRFDWIYVSLDPTKMANPAVDASDVATFVTSRSTLSTSDNGTPPTFGYLLAVVTVANGFTTLANATISDKRMQSGVNSVGAGAVFAPAVVTASALATGAGHNYVITNESTSSNTYVALTTAQAVTVTIGANGMALVSLSAHLFSSASGASLMAYAVSGANTIAATDDHALLNNPGNTAAVGASRTELLTGLTPGSTTFTALFKATTGTSSFLRRDITVIPL